MCYAYKFPASSCYRSRIQAKCKVMKPLEASLTSSSSSTSTSKIESIRTLIKDISDIIQSTDVKVGAVRSFQVIRASATLTQDFILNPDKFKEIDGTTISIPKTLRRFFEELGATYVKLGQFIASSPTLFPAEYVREFQSCLDHAPVIPYYKIRNIISKELNGQPISDVFLFIDPVPLASASIAQVHRAKLRSSGIDVVIKVRKPGVDSTLQADLGFLFIATKIAEYINPSLSRLSLANIVGDIRLSMLDELDFRKEAKNLLNFREYLRRTNNEDAVAPMPYENVSTSTILVMDYLKGVPLVDLEGIRKFSKNPEITLITALRTWAGSVMENDIFHADVHGGNLLVLENGKVGFIDFGIVGKISPTVWSALGDFVKSFVSDDYRGVAEALVQMGATDTQVDIEKFSTEIREVFEKIINIQPTVTIATSGSSIDASVAIDEKEATELILEVVAVADRNGLKLPREFGLLLKQSLYFDRYQKLLAPDLDPLRDVRVREAVMNADGNGNGPRISGPVVDVDILD